MNDADLFHQRIAHLGGRYEPPVAFPSIGQLHGNLLKKARGIAATMASQCHGMPPVHVELIADWSVNAYAFSHQGRLFIGINVGTLDALLLLFYRMLSDRRILPQIGDVNGEAADLPPVTRLDANSLEMFKAMTESGFMAIAPRGQVRQDYAQNLLFLALDFLMRHEFIHLANGHVGLLEQRNHSAVFAEFSKGSGTPLTQLDWQTLEMDADSGAISLIAGIVRRGVANPSSVPERWRHQFAEAMYPPMFAAMSVLRLFGDSSLLGIDLSADDHPLPRLRGWMLGSTVEAYLAKKVDSELERAAVNSAVLKAARDVFDAFYVLTGKVADMAWPEVDQGQQHIRRLTDNWTNKLRNELLPFAYHQHLPD
jgi:hypothetical protein